MKVDISLEKIAIIIGFIAQLFAGVWWLSQLSTTQDSMMEELKKTERLQTQINNQQETIFELRYKLGILENRR